jgi:MoaA/NifB/PqqE/SkfB family radical SAM enzyme
MTRSINFFNRKIGLNIDITYRCPLECPRCQRQTAFTNRGKNVYGVDISLDDIKKLAKHFKCFSFCGSLSDPVHHPKFIEILKYFYENNLEANVHNASSAKPKSWYIKAFKANPRARWTFGIDGLPEESCMYRINQDGEKLFDVMVESKNHLLNPPWWQFIVFSYNEKNLEKAKKMAVDNGVNFITIQTSRWTSKDDPLLPSKKYALGHTRI